MDRNYKDIDRYLTLLQEDIYAQPADEHSTELRQQVFDEWVSQLFGVKKVLDIGCGQGICYPMAKALDLEWTGITLGPDYVYCKSQDLPVVKQDMNFMEFDHESFDLLLAFHVLEHSPMPLLTLLHWWDISKNYLCVVLPNPNFIQMRGQNHYSVMNDAQFKWLARRSGWQVIWSKETDEELRYMCAKTQPQKE